MIRHAVDGLVNVSGLGYNCGITKGKQMKLTHTVNVSVEFDKDKTPDYVITALVNYPESALNKMLAEVFITSLDTINALQQINDNNSYAKVTWGDN